ncbi:MAG: phosphonate ABC transporter ATP-binding protein [Candidatus Sumerlaeota bacterium]|nr:phosphonate ABC transporter ATP-binding protein [Candidatus Sumerlaeota bacterium]
MSVAANILEIRALNKFYDNGVHALNNVSFDVRRGEFLVVIGLSGSGKSTLLRCINRLIEPTSGGVIFNGVDLTRLSFRQLRQYRRKIGMIFQQFNLIKRKTVLANVLAGGLGSMPTLRSVAGLFSESERRKASENLKIVGLEDKARVRADELSGGQQQRVAIARSLMQAPDILLADEPVASLDPATSHSVMKYLQDANQRLGKTIVCNLHFLSLVRTYGTRVIALKAGELVFEGQPSEIDEAWFRKIYGEEAIEVKID